MYSLKKSKYAKFLRIYFYIYTTDISGSCEIYTQAHMPSIVPTKSLKDLRKFSRQFYSNYFFVKYDCFVVGSFHLCLLDPSLLPTDLLMGLLFKIIFHFFFSPCVQRKYDLFALLIMRKFTS